jgi:hypothetical protein
MNGSQGLANADKFLVRSTPGNRSVWLPLGLDGRDRITEGIKARRAETARLRSREPGTVHVRAPHSAKQQEATPKTETTTANDEAARLGGPCPARVEYMQGWELIVGKKLPVSGNFFLRMRRVHDFW